MATMLCLVATRMPTNGRSLEECQGALCRSKDADDDTKDGDEVGGGPLKSIHRILVRHAQKV